MTSIAVSTNGAEQSAPQLKVEYVPPESYPALRQVVRAWKTFASDQRKISSESLSKMDEETLNSLSTVYRNNMEDNVVLFTDSAVVCGLIAIEALDPQSPFLVYQCVETSSQTVEGVIVLKYNPKEDPDTMYVKHLASNPKNLPPSLIDSTQQKVRGVGAKLLQHAEEEFIQKKESLSGGEQIWVTAFKRSCEFYKRQGFIEAQNRAGAFTQPMYKKIADVPSSTFLKAASE